MSSFRITYVDGSEEVTPEGTDYLRTDPNGRYVWAMARRTYGPDQVLASYVFHNIRKTEPLNR